MTERRVLVTGASGFIGGRVLEPLVERGFEVHAVSRSQPAGAVDGRVRWHAGDLLDPTSRRRVVADAAASHLLHLAWYAEPGAFWAARENAAWVSASVDLIDAFAAAGGRRVVAAGTCAEYDWTDVHGPLAEHAPIAPATFYGTCKDATRRVIEGLAAQAGFSQAWGRVFFLYGPGEDERRLVGSVARKLVDGERAPTSEGTQIRDFLHVDDVARGFAALVDADVEGPVNIGSGERVSVREVVDAIADAAGARELLDVGAVPMREGDPDELVADATVLRSLPGGTPRIPLDRGVATVLDALRSPRA